MNIDALLEDYMKNPKWAGKIFMQDEKTCYIDGLIAGAKAMQEENEQLKAQIEKMIQDVSDMKYFTSFGTVTNACKELLRKWEVTE